MDMSEELLDATVAVDETVTAQHETHGQLWGRGYTYYLYGDENAASFDLEWYVQPHGDDRFYHHRDEDIQNEDITEGETYRPDMRGARSVRLELTNTGNDPTEMTVRVAEYIQ